jgi:hypothetical protein
MTNIFWEIDELISEADGLVTQVNCSINADDGNDTVKFDLRIPLSRDNSFTPYAELTKPQVLEWVKKYLGAEFFDQHNKIVSDLLNPKKG